MKKQTVNAIIDQIDEAKSDMTSLRTSMSSMSPKQAKEYLITAQTALDVAQAGIKGFLNEIKQRR